MRNFLKIHCLLATVSLHGVAFLNAETVFTEPLGFNKITCLANSDTIVGVPFRAQGSIGAILSADPVVAGDGESATLTLSLANLETDALNTHYLKFDGGTRDGRWYHITANTGNSVTIDLNGDNVDGVLAQTRVVIAEYWTLDTLFPPAQATTAWTYDSESDTHIQNGHAIVASGNILVTQRRTELLLPNTTETGVSRLPGAPFFITSSTWRRDGISGNVGSQSISPDSYLIIRHRLSVLHPTIFRSFGEVELKNISVPLSTNVSGRRDTYVAIPRPVDVRLDELNLIELGAFVASGGVLVPQRRDQLVVFDNSLNKINKLPTAAYFYSGGHWRIDGSSDPQNHVVIPAGSGFVVRKHQTITGSTAFWHNTPNYPIAPTP